MSSDRDKDRRDRMGADATADQAEPTVLGMDAIDSADRPADGRGGRPAFSRRGLTAAGAALALVLAGAAGGYLARGDGSQELAVAAGSTASSAADEDADDDDRGPLERFRDRDRDGRYGMFGGMHRPGRGFGPGLGMGAGPGALHGTFVVPDGDDGYRTVVVQHGEVTDVSATSLTVRSEDGYSQTYRLTEDTVWLGDTDGVEDLDEGDRVHVSGTRAGDTTTAVHVADLSRFEDMLERRLPGPQGSPSPTTEGSTAETTALVGL